MYAVSRRRSENVSSKNMEGNESVHTTTVFCGMGCLLYSKSINRYARVGTMKELYLPLKRRQATPTIVASCSFFVLYGELECWKERSSWGRRRYGCKRGCCSWPHLSIKRILCTALPLTSVPYQVKKYATSPTPPRGRGLNGPRSEQCSAVLVHELGSELYLHSQFCFKIDCTDIIVKP